nr:hypothetical protein [Tanacetum cinerariifolium]
MLLRLLALVDKKNIVISEDAIHEILQLDDAEGVSVEVPDSYFSSIFKYQKTTWNEFSTTMASTVICLSKGQRFNFSRVEGLESANTAQQLEIIKLKARVKKLERLNKGRKSVDIDEGIEFVDDQEKDAQVKGRKADTQAEIYNIDLDHTSKVIPAAEHVVADVSTPISTAKPKVLKVVPAALTISTRKTKGVVIRDPEEELHDDTPAEQQSAKDKGKGLFVEDPKPMKKKDQIAMDAEYARKLQEEEESLAQAIDVQPKDAPAKGIQYIRRYHGYKKKPQSESEACKNMIAYLKNTKGFKMAFFKGKTYDQICPIFQARFDANMRFLLKSKEEIEKEEEEIIKIADEDDDVFIEATPIGIKVPVANYEIVMINNKPRYKIFRADDTHQLYTSFITLLKNFDREDLEDLWKIVKARFSTSKPNNFTDDYLLDTLKNMFEKTDAQDVIWRSQQTKHGQALVKSWKLLTLCGVHIITFTTTMFVLLVEKKYPLSRFTLEQLVNVARLKVKEMSLELLRFTR